MAQSPATREKDFGLPETGSLAEGIHNDTPIAQTSLQQDAEAQRERLNLLREQTQNSEWNQKLTQEERKKLASKLSGLEGFERVVVPSQPSTKTFIPFGIDGTSVIISQYGEILRMSRQLAEEKPRFMCLTSPNLEGYERDLVNIGGKLHDEAQTRDTGLNICLMPVSKAVTPLLRTELEWINGRWPCVYYEIDGVNVSVLFTVSEGILSQHYSIMNTSPEEKAIQYALQFGGAEVNTLHAEGNRWAGDEYDLTAGDRPKIRPNMDGSFLIVEKDATRARHVTKSKDIPRARGEAVIAIFHNDSLIDTKHIIPVPGRRYNSDGDRENGGHNSGSDSEDVSRTSRLLQIPSNGVQKFVVQYVLRSHGSKDTRVLEQPDMVSFLQGDQSGSWSFKQDHKFNSIWRRHLEYVLGLCQAKTTLNTSTENGGQIAFINDITLESGSTPLNDFYIFRFLLIVYQILEQGDQTCSTDIDKSALQGRIKETCKGHLRWSFSIRVFLASQSWPLSTESDDEDEADLLANKANDKAFIGSLQMLKLYGFATVFREEALLIDECLQKGANKWLDELAASREKKSELWYKDTKSTYVAWEGRRDEGSEWFDLPEYRLGDLIYIWKALKSLEEMVCNSDGCTHGGDESLTSVTLMRLNDKKLGHYNVRKLILQRFIYQNLDNPPKLMADQHDLRDPGNVVQKTESIASSFAIAVRRSRDRDRLLFSAKDTLIYDGLEWSFFNDDLKIETLSASNELVNVNVHVSWVNTIRAQGVEREAIWQKSLWYALAITVAKMGSLDSSKDPKELEEISWERLLGCVTPYGSFAEEIDCDTKLPDFSTTFSRSYSPFYGSRQSCWEIPTLLLRRRFESLELDLFRDTTLVSALTKEAVATQQDATISGEDDTGDHAQPIASTVEKMKSDIEAQTGISQDAKDIMRKEILIEKKKLRSHKKVELEMISDPLDRKVRDWLYPFPDFIAQQPPYRPMEEEEKRLDRRLDIDFEDHPDDSLRKKLEKILYRGVRKWKSVKSYEREGKFSWNTFSAVIVDVGRHRRVPDVGLCDADELDLKIREGRTVERAKKRFHYLGPLQIEHALILYLASPSQDKRNMAQFYIRHTSFLSHMQEDVHPLVDVWSTELHLSFLQLVDVELTPQYEEDFQDYDVCNGRQREFPQIVKGSQFDLYKASLSYRLVGDMGDKFWSGYLLTYLPGSSKHFAQAKDSYWAYGDSTSITKWFNESTNNDQRKIFEPFLVEKMAAEVYRSTDILLGSIDEWLDPAIESPKDKKESTETNIPKVDNRNYDVQYNRSTTCLDLEAALNPLRRLSTSNVESLRQWSKREMERHYKPRWSEKDERKYRDLVDHQKRRADQQIALLENQHGRIETCIEQVKSHRAQLTDNLSLTDSRTAAHESENIRIFTYATVVFYPLSFVASLFSMQGPPSHSTTSLFIQATAIALVVTLLIVFNAEILAWPIRRLRYSISHTARKKMQTTSNIFPVKWQTTLLRIKQAEEHDVLHDNEMPRWPRSKFIYLVFLLVYLLVEIPAHQLVLAYESLTRMDIRTQDRVVLASVRVLIAIIVLPVFVTAWSILVFWSLLHWALKSIWVKPQNMWLKKQKQTEEMLRTNAISTEKAKGQDGEKDSDRKGQPSGTQEEKSNKNQKQSKGQDSDEKVRDKIEEELKLDRKKNAERNHEQVKMLINPPELYNAKLKRYERYIRRKPKGSDNESIRSGKNSVASSILDENGAITKTKTPDQSEAPPNQGLIPSWLWPFSRHRTEKAAVDQVAV